MFSGPPKTCNHKFHLIFILLVIFSVWTPTCSSYRLSPNLAQLEHNGRCPGRSEVINWKDCQYGGYIENPDPRNCSNRYVCYKGLNEKCRPGVDKCADHAICTHCEICQKCDSPETCSEFNLCPQIIYGIQRLIQKRLLGPREE